MAFATYNDQLMKINNKYIQISRNCSLINFFCHGMLSKGVVGLLAKSHQSYLDITYHQKIIAEGLT